MNAPERIDLPDIQSREDARDIAIDAVGIRGLRYPVTVRSGHRHVATIATWSMSVALAATVKGTHMSRFIQLVERHGAAIDAAGLCALASEMLRCLNASRGTIELEFPYFIHKEAPVSRIGGLVDYQAGWRVSASVDGGGRLTTRVVVPVTSLCPCSKEISDYGAHHQRSHVTIEAC